MGGNDSTTVWVVLLGLAAILAGGSCIALLFWDEFVVVVVDIKERMLGQRRSRYDEYR
ncbi:hypothetical protein [Haloarchaeobius sp. HME9146]|uniref:hypothetical protein n=1 Tax=Haloarchaeobius sp. HME9146 TaxID=2978732 RepID=UPI0021C098A6|nr:hypothetical protein [Haloarchaeobius sp. HME9146]MCT9097396.1 hypothetical protein [Haloarchaeobius sp. HME9146]